MGTGKLIIGFILLSFFTCVNALYTYGIILAKACAIRGTHFSDDIKNANIINVAVLF